MLDPTQKLYTGEIKLSREAILEVTINELNEVILLSSINLGLLHDSNLSSYNISDSLWLLEKHILKLISNTIPNKNQQLLKYLEEYAKLYFLKTLGVIEYPLYLNNEEIGGFDNKYVINILVD